MEFKEGLSFDNVLILPNDRVNLNSRSQVNTVASYTFRNGLTWSGVPVIAANMDTVGTFAMFRALREYRMLTALHKHYSFVDWINFALTLDKDDFNYFMPTIGVCKQEITFFCNLMWTLNDRIKFVNIDVANGYIPNLLTAVSTLRKKFPTLTISAGNVVTPDRAVELVKAGADIVKVGIGSGSACLTRRVAGVGRAQVSAVMECAEALEKLDALVVSDGGCKNPGDVNKALVAGAGFVMVGGLFSGTDQSAGKTVRKLPFLKKYKKFYGMSSDTAMKKYSGGVASYRASEGRTLLIPYKGSASTVCNEIIGGINSACTYVGAEDINQLRIKGRLCFSNEQLNTSLSG